MSDIQEPDNNEEGSQQDVVVEQQQQQTQPSENPMIDQREKRSAIAAAALARIQQQRKVEDHEKESKELDKERIKHEMKIRRLINEVAGSVNYETAYACLKLLFTLFNNILEHPQESKFRSFRSNQPKIQREIFSVENSEKILIETGFRTRALDFQQEWFIPNHIEWPENCLGMKKVVWSRNLIEDRMKEYSDNVERQKDKEQRERIVEKSRKARALAEAQEDRERVALRIQREKIARRAEAAAMEKQAKAPETEINHSDIE